MHSPVKWLASNRSAAALLAAALCAVACAAACSDANNGTQKQSAAKTDSAAPAAANATLPARIVHLTPVTDTLSPISQKVVVFMEASEAELADVKAAMKPEAFAATADDMMFYRTKAHEYLDKHRIPVITVTGRKILSFKVNGVTKTFNPSKSELLDMLVVYDGTHDAHIVATNEVEQTTKLLK